MKYKFIKLTELTGVRRLLRGVNNLKCSSIYIVNRHKYMLVSQEVNIPAHVDSVWICTNFTSIETEVYRWAWSELEDSITFVQCESASKLIDHGRVLYIHGSEIIRSFDYLTDIFAVLNYTKDSFSDGGKYNTVDNLYAKALDHIKEGVRILDIGVESSNSRSVPIEAEQEIKRLTLILGGLIEIKKQHKVLLSIDTYHKKTVQWLLDQDIDIINDISGNMDIDLVKCITMSHRKYVAMHSLVIPVSPKVHIAFDINHVEHIYAWMINKIENLDQHGVNLNNVIFDVGIGFGLTPIQSWEILKHISDFLSLPCELLIGHSRKGFFNHICRKEAYDRDLETAIVGLYMLNRVDYLRMHEMQVLNDLYKIKNQLNFVTA